MVGFSVIENSILPPSGVYLMALLIILVNICCTLKLSPLTYSCSILLSCTSKLWWWASISERVIASKLSTSSARLKSSSVSSIFPFSMRDISSTSLINPSRWRLDLVIFPRQSITRSGWSIFAPAMAVIPTIAFIGVRISWDIFDKNSVFDLFALLAAS